MYALRVVVVSTRARIWLTTYVCITHVYAKPECMPIKHTKNTCACAHQNAIVQSMQTKDACVLFMQTMMHMAAD